MSATEKVLSVKHLAHLIRIGEAIVQTPSIYHDGNYHTTVHLDNETHVLKSGIEFPFEYYTKKYSQK